MIPSFLAASVCATRFLLRLIKYCCDASVMCFLTLAAVHVIHSVLLKLSANMIYLIVYLLRQTQRELWAGVPGTCCPVAVGIMNLECYAPSKQSKINKAKLLLKPILGVQYFKETATVSTVQVSLGSLNKSPLL